ncbi:AfsR/SARP family transcriptional regulator [Streptomyces rhizosphaerihabitans]|uniref:AfsR/SARP family transcriptional regulator n=1 Tax=Streptomyces rhizosphaerihabitans TaxID=1266770 RepID=UPI0021C07D97|nr:AfsR/SARP family transcriptional regulator [Streptomyces rhizosphaerihabitans]MCT9011747.1 AfsR/SARP family transcriptional regulator [Streptomyces rhizosphaerihabitans]
MDIDVLGALDVRENEVSIAPTAPKPRQVLALLALRAGQVVPVGVLAEELWGSKPPRSARATLQTYILQLRELITAALDHGAADGTGTRAADAAGHGAGAAGHGAGGGAGDRAGGGQRRLAKDVLLTVPGGYLLKNGDGTSDVRKFERLAGFGYRAMDAEDYPQAARLLRQALGLWTGPALADVQAGPQLQTEVKRLEESRLCALDQRVEADLRLGRHRELLAELTVLVNRYPTHESLCGQYMLALYRSGRRGEALDAYQRLRATLVRTMGLEPSSPLAKLQRSILMSGSDSLPAHPAAGASAAPVG